ncbi:MAG: type II toxin-antitoxin system VapB family antitoxin [Bdellovibrionota bacterium]
MRTTLILKDDLIEKARQLTGIEEKTALIHKGLELLIQKEAAKRLARFGGSDPGIKAPPRKKHAI